MYTRAMNLKRRERKKRVNTRTDARAAKENIPTKITVTNIERVFGYEEKKGTTFTRKRERERERERERDKNAHPKRRRSRRRRGSFIMVNIDVRKNEEKKSRLFFFQFSLF